MRVLMRGIGRLSGVLLALLFLAAAIVLLTLRGSLPRLDGEANLRGLSAKASVERDALGVVTVSAETTADAMRTLGFVHAQERYFEMDLMRRVPSGELSELFGAKALPLDREHRLHRMRARAAVLVASLAGADRERMDAYVDGVNQGLAALSARPFPYLLLRQQPRPWTAEDSVLVVMAMMFDLNDSRDDLEYRLGQLRGLVPASLFRFLNAQGSEWDAPLHGAAIADPEIPPATDVDLRQFDPKLFNGRGSGENAIAGDIGSNNFGVAGRLTKTGAAMVANDMHLGLRVPNIWFRARLRFAHADGRAIDVCCVSLPGVPAMVAGSNGHIAWGFTNSYGDYTDWFEVHWLDGAHKTYRTAEGEKAVLHHDEVIHVAGAADEHLDVRETIWGPILHDDAPDVSLALAWTAHRPGGVNLRMADMEGAQSVDEALKIAAAVGMPVQNLMVGDRDGHLAWTLAGQIPARSGFDGTLPVDGSEPGVGWTGWLSGEARPKVVDPEDGRLATANARTIEGDELARVGNGGYALGARQRQIRDDLRALESFEPKDFLAIQIDDRSLFLKRWWELLRKTTAGQGEERLAELDAATATWNEHASTDAVSYRLTRVFRLYVHAAVLDGLSAPARAKQPDFKLPPLNQAEGIVWKLLGERPAHLLAPEYADWDALLRAAAQRAVDDLHHGHPGPLTARTWGEKNTVRIQHPLSKAVPALSWLLDEPARQLPGDSNMPRVQGVAFGASERFGVSPGHEDQGYFHMPGGQSGHPLSPFYRTAHADWEEGRLTPFLPGARVYALTLIPSR